MTKIEWVRGSDGARGLTWNPIVGCSVTSPGCTNCYAMRMAARLEAMGQERYAGLTKPSKAGAVWTGELRLVEDALTIPLRRARPTTYFVNSMSDLFHESVPDAWIDRVFAVMALCPQHTFQVLTKRSARMRAYMAGCEMPPSDLPLCKSWITQWHRRDGVARAMHEIAGRRFADRLGKVKNLPLPNVWLGVSAEDQARADARIPDLLATPAAVRFVSAEPLLGPIDFMRISLGRKTGVVFGEDGAPDRAETFQVVRDALMDTGGDFERLDWIIVGGESGLNARPMQLSWARSIVEQCHAADVACFVKQMGRSVRMDRHDAVQPVALGGGWRADGPGAPEGIVTFVDRKGGDPLHWPADLRVRQMPEARHVG